jgi:antitoxin component of RelBE/YafQ-DinJ toxin-antitoxin module
MEVKDDQIRIRIDKTLKEKFAKYAKSTDMDQSKIIRNYVKFLVDQNAKVNNEKTN